MRLWKALGLAGFAGIAATGAIIVRDERRRAKLTPEEVRDRLHERVKATQTTRTPGISARPHPPSHDHPSDYSDVAIEEAVRDEPGMGDRNG